MLSQFGNCTSLLVRASAVAAAWFAAQTGYGQCAFQWDSAFAAGGGTPGFSGAIRALAEFNEGGTPRLFAAGQFANADGTPANNIARWDGTAWSAVGLGLATGGVHAGNALAVFDPPGPLGPGLYVGGGFPTAGGVTVNNIARWDGTGWSALIQGGHPGVNGFGSVDALQVFDDGSGPALFVGGGFTMLGTTSVARIAKWDGTTWYPLGSGMDAPVKALAVHNDGGGDALYAGGEFLNAGGGAAKRIAKWNHLSGTWSQVGNGLDNRVLALASFSGQLYAGGDFQADGSGAPSLKNIARFNGTAWTSVDLGVNGGSVLSLRVFNEGAGDRLFVGGTFGSASFVANTSKIARWDGTAFSSLGTGVTGSSVAALAGHNDGSGLALYAGGGFTSAGGFSSTNIARWKSTGGAPVITDQPDSLTVCIGDPIVLMVTATGSPAPTYQWRKGGSPISGATTDTLTISSAVAGDAGSYDVVVSNACGAVTSTAATVTISNQAPVLSLNGPPNVTLECHIDVYTELGATGSDDCDDTVTVVIGGQTVDVNTPGVYVVTYDATDSQGNPATQLTRSVTVQDTTPPTLNVNTAPITVTDTDCDGSQSVVLPAAVATDACDGNPNVIITRSDSQAPNAPFPAGQTVTVQYVAQDAAGNPSAPQTVDVTVRYGATVKVTAIKLLVGPGAHPLANKQPLVGIDVNAYDISNGSCAEQVSGFAITWQDYPDIMSNCTPVNTGTTDANGEVTIDLPPGWYLLLSHIDTDGNNVPDTYLAKHVGYLCCGEVSHRRMRLIETVWGKKLPCKIKKYTGSELLVVEPEYMTWESSEQLYPFVFESEGAWGVTAEITPPEGFVADYPWLATQVNNEVGSLQFTVTEIGSDFVPTETRLIITHREQVIEHRSSIGIRLTEDYVRSRGYDPDVLRKQGVVIDPPAWQSSGASEPAEPNRR